MYNDPTIRLLRLKSGLSVLDQHLEVFLVLGMSNEATLSDEQARRDSILVVSMLLEAEPLLADVLDTVDSTFIQAD